MNKTKHTGLDRSIPRQQCSNTTGYPGHPGHKARCHFLLLPCYQHDHDCDHMDARSSYFFSTSAPSWCLWWLPQLSFSALYHSELNLMNLFQMSAPDPPHMETTRQKFPQFFHSVANNFSLDSLPVDKSRQTKQTASSDTGF